jgi:hypothetical protein
MSSVLSIGADIGQKTTSGMMLKREEQTMTLNKAIKLLEEEYERAKTIEWVQNPLAYALYQVWKKVDAEKG